MYIVKVNWLNSIPKNIIEYSVTNYIYIFVQSVLQKTTIYAMYIVDLVKMQNYKARNSYC